MTAVAIRDQLFETKYMCSTNPEDHVEVLPTAVSNFLLVAALIVSTQ